MKIPEPINSTIITNRTKFTVFVSVFITAGTALSGYLFYLTKSIFIFVAGVFTIFFFPLIFQRTFRKKFSQDVLVTFSQDGFTVEFDGLDKNNNMRIDVIKLENVKLFKSSVDYNNDFSILKIVLKDGSKLDYTFSGQKNDNISETDINFAFKKIIESFNITKETGDRIKIIPSFYTTKTALYLGLILTFAMAMVAIYFGIKNPKTFILSIGFVAIYFQMVALRKRAVKDRGMFS